MQLSFYSMTDVTTSVNELLKGYNAGFIRHRNYSLEHISAFLKEAYQIVSLTPASICCANH